MQFDATTFRCCLTQLIKATHLICLGEITCFKKEHLLIKPKIRILLIVALIMPLHHFFTNYPFAFKILGLFMLLLDCISSNYITTELIYY